MFYSTYHLQLVILCTVIIFKHVISLNLSVVPFSEVFSPLYGNENVAPYDNGKSVQLSMTQWLKYGSGFVSKYAYNHGLFTASIKLPNNSYSAGVVATFYTQNKEKDRDEIDLEFLGHIHGEEWLLQTNYYGVGSVNKGREERYTLSFDPSKDFHNYSILWNTGRIIFYVDGLPVRVVENVEGTGVVFPSKPMYLYGTIWDGSDWATHKGKYRVDFQNGPFVVGYSSFVINGCRLDQVGSTPPECDIGLPNGISETERRKMNLYRAKYMTYSYCQDTDHFASSLPECMVEGPDMQLVGSPDMQPVEGPDILG